MRKLGLSLAASACVMVPSMALSQNDIIATLFGKATEIYKDKGYKPNGWEQRGELKQGAETRLQVKLTGGKAYSIVGMCDTDCGNADIVLLDASGKEVTKDVEKDDFPIVNVTASGNYTVRLIMVACKSDPCAYGAKAFVQ
jgi:hypothetical protein